MLRVWSCAVLLLLCACGGGGSTTSDIGPAGSYSDLMDVMPFADSSPYVNVLKDCALAADQASLCTMTSLPLIGQDFAAPTVADIMDRVLVSHPWMADRFEQVLTQLPADILTLFKGVTAIVIDNNIRPSFYVRETAAIYLDPANLWLTNAEKATISTSVDYRSDYGAELLFIPLWRYVQNSSYAYYSYSLDGTETRQISDIIYPFSRLLFHELAHANDFLPPTLQSSLDRQLTPYAASLAVENQSVSVQLETISPLLSTILQDLGKVLFWGDPATPLLKSYAAAWVGNEFENDAANETYSYSSKYEDVAMLFEETMMKYHFNIDRDIAFSDRPLTSPAGCDDYLVQWGVRNRLGDPRAKPRAQLVVANLLPDSDLSAFFAGFPPPTAMTTNLGWCSNLALATVTRQGVDARTLAPDTPLPPDQFKGDLLSPEY